MTEEHLGAALGLIFASIFLWGVTHLALDTLSIVSVVAPAAPVVDAPPLLLPLQCDAWVVQSGDGIATPRARCYYFKDHS